MFGYVKPFVPELKVKENEFYRAVYCGLCKALGRKSRLLSFTLSYDFVFLAIVDMAVNKEQRIELGRQRCYAHPLKKRSYIEGNPSLDRTAGAAALLLYYDLLDDIADGRGIKKLLAKLALPKARRIRKKHIGDGRLDGIIAKKLDALSKIENDLSGSVYAPADIFGQLLGEVFRNAGDGDPESPLCRCLYTLGRYTGRWIYVVDALDDIKKDKKSGSYNPFVISGEADDPEFGRRMNEALIFELIEAEKALDLIEIPDAGLRDIVYNILRLGMPTVAKKVIAGEYGKNNKKRKVQTYGEGSL